MPRRQTMALAFAAVLAGACEWTSEGAPPPEGTADAIERKLVELEQRLEEARDAVRRARETRARAARKISELERDGRELRRRLDEARRSGKQTWTDIEQAIDRTMTEIESTLGVSEEGRTGG